MTPGRSSGIKACHDDLYISGPDGQIDLKIGGTHTLVIINQHTKCHQNRRRLCKCLIDLTWNAPIVTFTESVHGTGDQRVIPGCIP